METSGLTAQHSPRSTFHIRRNTFKLSFIKLPTTTPKLNSKVEAKNLESVLNTFTDYTLKDLKIKF